MPSFNFQPKFIEPIRLGIKGQTIRSTRRCKAGDTMYLFSGLRTKQCIRIAQRPCVISDYVHLAPDGITLGNVSKHPRDIDEFARLDGFADYAEMHAWFADRYGVSHYCGFVHRWLSEPAHA